VAALLAVVVEVPAVEAELAADALWALGVVAIEEREPPEPTGGADAVELWTSLGPDRDTAATALAALAERWPWRFVEVDADVVNTWRTFARPTRVLDDLVVVPAWFGDPLDAQTRSAIVLRIDPGEAFGMGDHPTTVACLRALRREVRAGAAVLDVGCGSGVLGIAGLHFGAGRVDAIDIAPAAVHATLENAHRNGVADRIRVSTTPLAEVVGAYDVVVANILAPTLRHLADDLCRVVGPGGVLIVSGLLADRYQDVVEALAPLKLVEVETWEGWVALTLRP